MMGKIYVLRDFRGRYLITYGPGRLVVNTYYRHIPAVAEHIAERVRLSRLIPILLLPVIGMASLSV